MCDQQSRSSSDMDEPIAPPRKRICSRTSNNACTRCIRMFSTEGQEDLNSRHGLIHHSRAECVTSATDGCALCQAIMQHVSREHGECWQGTEHLVFRNKGSAPTSQILGIDILQGSLKDTTDFIRIYPFAKACITCYLCFRWSRIIVTDSK